MSEISHYTILSQPRSEGKKLSLKASVCGNPPDEGRFLIFPGGETVRLKSRQISTEGKAVFLEVKGAARSSFQRDTVLISEENVASEGRKALVLWTRKPTTQMTSGSAYSLRLRDTPDLKSPDFVNFAESGKGALISSRVPFIQIPGQIYSLEAGREKAEFILLMAEPWTSDEQKKMKVRLSKNPNFPGEEAVFSMNLRVRGAMQLPPSLKDVQFEGAVRLSSWLIMSRVYDKALSTLQKRSCAENGIRDTELAELLKLPSSLCRVLTERLIDEGKLIRKRAVLINQSQDQRAFLSPMSRKALDDLGAAGRDGILIKDINLPEKSLDALECRDLLVRFETFLMEKTSYNRLKDEILQFLSASEGLERSPLLTSMESLGLSRSRVRLLLKKLEEEKALSRDEDGRYHLYTIQEDEM